MCMEDTEFNSIIIVVATVYPAWWHGLPNKYNKKRCEAYQTCLAANLFIVSDGN